MSYVCIKVDVGFLLENSVIVVIGNEFWWMLQDSFDDVRN